MSQAPAGWYPQEDGRQRYWDGSAWTEHFAPGQQIAEPGRVRAAVQGAVRSAVSTPVDDDPDALWRAVGKPLTGLGAGRYKVTAHYLFFEKGLLSTDAQQVPISAVVDVDVRQSMSQKARGVGNVVVHVQRARGVEVVTMEDIPNFREGQRIINETAHAARLAIQRHANTHRTENTHLIGHVGQPTGAPFQMPVVPGQVVPSQSMDAVSAAPVGAGELAATPAPPAVDPIEQLRQLGQLRDAGILTSEEFDAKKSEILARM
ncbi:hypothetical protein GCM10027517_12010 [Phycicoccus ginsengisoli]